MANQAVLAAVEGMEPLGGAKAKQLFKAARQEVLAGLPRGKDYVALVDDYKCIGCTQCVYYCNFASIDMVAAAVKVRTRTVASQKAFILHDTCTGCTLCAFACPVEAISMIDRPPEAKVP